MAGVNLPDSWISLVHPAGTQPEGTFVDDDAPLPVKLIGGGGGGGGSSSVVVVGIVDGDGDSVFDDVNDAVRVALVAGSVTTGQADRSSFTDGATIFQPIGGVYNETSSVDPTEDQAAAARITAKRALHVNLRTEAGAPLSVDSANRLRITGPVPDDGVSFNTAAPVTMGGEDSFGFARVFRMGDAATLPDFRTMATAQYVNNPNNPASSAWVRRIAFQGTEGNAWSSSAVAAGGVSNAIDCEHQAFVTVAGRNEGGTDTNITLEISQDDSTYYSYADYGSVLAGLSFVSDHVVGFRWLRLRSSAATVMTSTIASKTG